MSTNCGSGKKVFFSRAYAKKRARELMQVRGPLQRAYRCPLCDQWHLTSHSTAEARAAHRASVTRDRSDDEAA